MASTRHQLSSSLVLLVCFLKLIVISAAVQSTTLTSERNGVRLAGGDATRGRLEVRLRGGGTWAHVCDSGLSEWTATTMCVMLGYKYGAKIYSQELVYPEEKAPTINGLMCYQNPNAARTGTTGRRSLMSAAASSTGGDVADTTTAQHGRRLLSNYIDSASDSPHICMFVRIGGCDAAAPVAAIQCSNTAMPPALPPPPISPAMASSPTERNGVRLAGGDAARGRLEVRLQGGNTWAHVCDEGFSDYVATTMCVMLGYQHGAKIYSQELVYPAEKASFTVKGLICYQNPNSFRGTDNTRRSLASKTGGVGRHLLSNYIDSGADSPLVCHYVHAGACNPAAPVTAIQCSNTTLPPLPPPPPSPPSPPPSPPPAPPMVRIITNTPGVPETDGDLERNLCTPPTAVSGRLCSVYARVEMQVESPNKKAPGKIWAPVCNITNVALARSVAKLACEQRYQQRKESWLPPMYYIDSAVSPTPFLIPKASSTARTGDFNSKQVGGWVTITGGDPSVAERLQDLNYKVSTAACSKSAMLAIGCYARLNAEGLR